MASIEKAVILGNVYDPETDCQYVMLKITAKDWDSYLRDRHKEEYGGLE